MSETERRLLRSAATCSAPSSEDNNRKRSSHFTASGTQVQVWCCLDENKGEQDAQAT